MQKTSSMYTANVEHIVRPSIEVTEISNEELEVTGNVEEKKSVGPEVLLDPKMSYKIRPFEMEWSFGFDNTLPIVCFSTGDKPEIMYASNNYLILYNYVAQKMDFLQAHQNKITSISLDKAGHYLVSADQGNDHCIVVWDAMKLLPVYTVFDPYPEYGVLAVGLSPSGKYLVSLGESSEYLLDFWLWTTGHEKSTDCMRIRNIRGDPKKITFDPNREENVMVVFENGVMFFTWDADNKKMKDASFPNHRNKLKVGNLTDGTYVLKSHFAFVSSDQGYVLKFGKTLYTKEFDENEVNNASMYINATKVSQGAITCIRSVAEFIVVGDSLGHMNYFDAQIKVLYWQMHLSLGAIKSFSLTTTMDRSRLIQSLGLRCEKEGCNKTLRCQKEHFCDKFCQGKPPLPSDSRFKPVEGDISRHVYYMNRDCFISTADGNIYAVDSWSNKCDPLFQPVDSDVGSIDTHTEKPYLLIAFVTGRLYLVDYKTRNLITSNMLPAPPPREDEYGYDEEAVTVTYVKYCPQSLHLACGRSNGEIWMLEPIMLTPREEKFHICSGKITKIAFSADSMQMAYIDTRMSTYLFLYNKESEQWVHRARTRAHYKEVTDIMFYPGIPSILITLGADRNYVRYNNHMMWDMDELFTPDRFRIEQSAIPNNMMWYPMYDITSKTGYIMIADNQYKFKLVNDKSLIPHSTALGPAYGCYKSNPVRKMMLIPETEGGYMVYMSKKHIGIQMLPADGNPYKFVGLTAHHEEVSDIILSYDGQYTFTFGVGDKSVMIWRTKIKAAKEMYAIGGTGLEPYYCLLEGGKNGWLFHEMQDLFYYMQILNMGENTVLPRKVSDMIPVSELPDLVRACGFYPSDFEIEGMMIDIKNREFLETNQIREELSFLEFVQLFINHRPAYGYSVEELENAFDTYVMSVDDADYGSITRENFVESMTTTGEAFNGENLFKCLAILLGEDQEQMDLDFEFMPDDIYFTTLTDDILGIDMERRELEQKEDPNKIFIGISSTSTTSDTTTSDSSEQAVTMYP